MWYSCIIELRKVFGNSVDVTNCKLHQSSKYNLNVVHACLVWTTFQYFSYASIVVTVLRVVRCGMCLEYFVYLMEFGRGIFRIVIPKRYQCCCLCHLQVFGKDHCLSHPALHCCSCHTVTRPLNMCWTHCQLMWPHIPEARNPAPFQH